MCARLHGTAGGTDVRDMPGTGRLCQPGCFYAAAHVIVSRLGEKTLMLYLVALLLAAESGLTVCDATRAGLAVSLHQISRHARACGRLISQRVPTLCNMSAAGTYCSQGKRTQKSKKGKLTLVDRSAAPLC